MPLFSEKFTAMGGENEILIQEEDEALAMESLALVRQEVLRIEKKYSRYLPDSVVSLINNSAGKNSIELDPETASLINYASACSLQSDGLFDITSGALRRVWKFRENKLPDPKQVKEILPLVGWSKIKWANPTLNLPLEGMELDFGGIGKEYAVDRAAFILEERGLKNYLVNLSGDIRVSGSSASGQPWSVGITDPRDGVGILGIVSLTSGAVATSGDYERVIEICGKRYSHILNPLTGWPAYGLQSVTVMADSCLIAGSITTTAMLLGEKGREYLEELNIPYILVTTKGGVEHSKHLQMETNV